MPRPRLPHLHKLTSRHGKTTWYVQRRRGAPRVRIREPYGTPEFEAAYQAALTNTPKPQIIAANGTLEWAWFSYKESGAWSSLKPATRKQRENIMLNVLKNGNPELKAVNRASIIEALDRKKDTPSAARNFLDTMRGLFGWLIQTNRAGADPTAGLKVKRPRTRGFKEWSYEEILQYESRWPLGTRERVMLDVYCYTGLRRGDAARVGRQHVSNGVISLQTEKTGEWVYIPVLDVLRRTLDAGPTGETFIVTSRGTAYVKESLGNAFKDACVLAGLHDKSAHGLRKAAATRAAEEGATEQQLMAIFGWTNPRQAAVYTRTANRRKLAAQAMGKLAITR